MSQIENDDVLLKVLEVVAVAELSENDVITQTILLNKSQRNSCKYLALVESESDKNRSFTGIEHYFENVIPKYTDLEFKSHFQMEKSTFEHLLNCLQDNLLTYATGGNTSCINPEKKLFMTLWYLANQESFRQIAERFGERQGTSHSVISKTIEVITKNQDRFIYWPTNYEDSAQKFFSKKNFPGVIGAIDGFYILCKPPNEGRDAFINRKGDPSIVLQAICNAQGKFIDVFADRSGSTHDARVFSLTPIREKMLYNNNFIPSDFHILGDSAYSCHNNLITPFRDNRYLTDSQKRFNYITVLREVERKVQAPKICR